MSNKYHRCGLNSEASNLKPEPTAAQIDTFFFRTYHDPDSDCILWAGLKNDRGYGYHWVTMEDGTKRLIGAHRISHYLATGDWPGQLVVAHSCNRRHCVNPDHLRATTQADNMADREAAGNTLRGEDHGGAKLSNFEVEVIRRRVAAGATQVSQAEAFGVSTSNICGIVKGTTRKVA